MQASGQKLERGSGHPHLKMQRAETVGERCGWHPKALHCITGKQNISQPYSIDCVSWHESLLPVPSCFSNGSLFCLSLAAFHCHARVRATIQTPTVQWFFCLQHCYSCFPDRVLKTRNKRSLNWTKLLLSVKKTPHSQADNCSVHLLPAGENSLQIFTRQNMLTGSCLLLLRSIPWKRCHLFLRIIKAVKYLLLKHADSDGLKTLAFVCLLLFPRDAMVEVTLLCLLLCDYSSNWSARSYPKKSPNQPTNIFSVAISLSTETIF